MAVVVVVVVVFAVVAVVVVHISGMVQHSALNNSKPPATKAVEVISSGSYFGLFAAFRHFNSVDKTTSEVGSTWPPPPPPPPPRRSQS